VLRAARFANARWGSRVPGWSRVFHASSARVASGTRTLKYFQSAASIASQLVPLHLQVSLFVLLIADASSSLSSDERKRKYPKDRRV